MSDGITIAGQGPMRKWRCTHGHKWEDRQQLIGVEITGEIFGLKDERRHYCGICLREAMDERLGQVREDT